MCKASIFKIVRLAAAWIFFWWGHKKSQKNDFFHKTLISQNLLKEANIQARSMWKLTSRAFRKCGTYWACHVFNGSYRPSKMDESEKTDPSPKISGVQKKRHGHNFENYGSKLNQRWNNHVGPTLIQFRSPKLKIVAVSFFFDTASSENFFFKFHPTLTANNSGLKPSKLKNYHIFGKPRTSAFSWYTLFRSYYLRTLRKMRFCFSSFHQK